MIWHQHKRVQEIFLLEPIVRQDFDKQLRHSV
jgi:hypothetical protein